jgi:transposase-like protein
MNIFELMELIQTKAKAIKLYQRIRWQNGLLCSKCGTYDSAYKHGKTKLGFQKYKCVCNHVFSDTSDTFLHRKRIDIRHLLVALYELSQTKGITSVELGNKLGISQKKAWKILHVLRGHCQDLIQPYYELMMKGVVETDEAHFGKGSNSQMVHGMVQRGQHAIILPICNRTEETLKGNIERHVLKQSYIMTDTASAYGSLSCHGYSHLTLNHSKEEFSKGNGIHGNTMEGMWGNQKKIIYGIHHGVKRKNLFNYVAEFLLKFNLKQANSTFPTFLNLFFNPPLTC